MFIYHSNSQLYHPPVVTIGLMVVNVAVAVFTANTDGVTLHGYELWYGDGLHPVQWFTSPFMHADSSHLIGNLTFLWPFGLLVEGKLGWWKFLLLYLAIAVGECAIEQTLLLGVDADPISASLELSPEELSDFSLEERQRIQQLLSQPSSLQPSSLGASSAIFGLLVVCILFAPASDFMVWIRITTIEVPILVIGGLYVGWELVQWHLSGFGIGSALLHLLGALVGGVVGVGYLRWASPQCDDQDLFNHLFNRSIAKPAGRSGRLGRSTRAIKGIKPPKTKKPTKKSVPEKQTTGWSDSRLPGSRQAPSPSLAQPSLDDFFADEVLPAGGAATGSVDRVIHPVAAAIEAGRWSDSFKGLQAISDAKELAQIKLGAYVRLYEAFAKAKRWKAAAMTLQKSLVGHPAPAEDRKLQLARICFVALGQPQSTTKILRSIRQERLTDSQKTLFRKLARATQNPK